MKSRYQISLSKKFILYSSVVMLWVFFYLSYLYLQERYEQNSQIISKLSSQMYLTEKIFDDSVKYTNLMISGLVDKIENNPTNENYIKNTLKSYRVTYDDQMKDTLSISMFSWVNSKDELIINSQVGFLSKSINLSDRGYLKLAKRQPGKLFLGEPRIGSVSGQYIIPAGIGVVDKNDTYRGSIVFGFNIESIYKRLLSSQIMDNSDLQIVYKNESNVIKNNFNISSEDLSKIDVKNPKIQILKQSLIKPSSTLIYKKFPNSNYGLIISHNYSESSGMPRKSYFLEFFSILAFLIILIYLLRKEFINPIMILSKEAESVGSGKIENIDALDSNVLEINQLSKSILSVREFVKNEQSLRGKLTEANQKLKALNRSISHDIRNYIFGISGITNLILGKHNKDNKSFDKEDIESLETIIQQSEEAGYFIEDLLDDEQLKSGKFTLKKVGQCSIAALMQRVILTSKNLANEHHITITTKIEAELPVIECDQRRMKQIFMNLISNAIKYSNEGGEVRIIIDQRSKIENPEQGVQKYLCIEIADDGIGMSEDEIPLALEGYGVRIDKSSLHKSVSIDSHGIGMPIIKNLVELHHGKLEIKSVKNVGTRVILWFNVDEVGCRNNGKYFVMDNNSAVSLVDHYSTAHKKILVVDDNPVNLTIIKGILNQENYEVFKANNGKEALGILDENPDIDLIIMDGKMSGMDGFETTKIIRNGIGFKKFTNYNVPIVAVMGDDDEETLEKIKECDMNGYVKKGASVESLIEAVVCHINRS